LSLSPNKGIAWLAFGIFVLDQASKKIVLNCLGYTQEKVVINGFFNLVHWRNTGAAWSMFHNNNELLAIVALVALLVLFLARHRFCIETTLGWVAMGLMFGGIAGNVADRLIRGHVIDFLYFYVRRRTSSGAISEIGFPAFNVADSAICIGVALLFILSLQKEQRGRSAVPADVGGDDSEPSSPKVQTVPDDREHTAGA
jgi:signal peptidase II